MTLERWLELAVGLVGVQCLATLGFIGWLSRPTETAVANTPPPPQAHVQQTGAPPIAAPESHTQGERRGPPRPPQRKYDDEADATQAYVDQVARAFDLAVLVSGDLDIDELEEAMLAARACESLDCDGVQALVEQAVQTGRPVPPLPTFGDAAHNPAAIAVAQYVHVVRGEVRSAAREEGRPELVPTDELFDAARDCTSFDCEGLDLLLEEVGVAMSALGRSVPPLPDLQDPP